MMKTLFDELNDCLKPPTQAGQNETLANMVDFDFFCNKFYGEIGDWLEENHPDDIIHRAERIDNERQAEKYENMTKRELKADESEYKVNTKYRRE